MIGRTIDNIYKIYDEVGSGGFSTVYLARNLRTNQVVALKVMHARLAGDPQQRERFRREARATQTVDSPYVVKILGYGEVDNLPYLVMDYVEGKTLAEIIQERGPLPIEEAVQIARQLAHALDAIHRAGLVHRDIKPQNIMIDHDETVKLMDLGIVKSAFMDGITQTGMFVGTPHYMSPEQAEGHGVDIRSDIYALGTVLYQMLTGQVPFDADSPWAVMRKHLETPPPMEPVQRRDVPIWLVDVLERMLAKEPAKRFQTPGELLNSLNFDTDMPAPSPPRQPRTELARPRAGLPTWVPFAGIGAVLLFGLSVLVLASGSRSLFKPTLTDTPTPAVTPTSTPTPTSSPTPTPVYQSGLITYLTEEEQGKNLYAIDFQGNPITLVQGAADVLVLAVSPDRSYLAIATSQTGTLSRSTTYPRFVEGYKVDLMVVSTDGRESTTMSSGVSHIDASYTPDGQLIVAILEGSTVTYIVSEIDGSKPRDLYRSENILVPPVPQPAPTRPPLPVTPTLGGG